MKTKSNNAVKGLPPDKPFTIKPISQAQWNMIHTLSELPSGKLPGKK